MSRQIDHIDHWPHFELVTFPKSADIPPEWDAELIQKGAPKSLFGRYQSANRLTLMAHQQYGQLVRFGSTMRTDSVCLDPHSKAVLWVTYKAGGLVWVVNTSLQQFSASVKIVIERFPFESLSVGVEQEQDEFSTNWDQAVEDLTQRLSQIDEEALRPTSGFWQTFLDDVQAGDFSRKDVLDAIGS